MWARRREVYGDQGHRPDALPSLRRCARKAIAARVAKTTKTCRKGHRWTEANTRLSTVDARSGHRRRYCRACEAIALGTQRWASAQAAKRQRERDALRREMISVGITANQRPESAYWQARLIKARTRWQDARSA